LNINNLKAKAQWLRKEIFEMVVRQNKGHIPSCYSCADIMVALYYGRVAHIIQNQPDAPNRDRIIVSKGHAAMVQYPILSDFGFFSKNELKRFTQPGGLLGMYADFRIPGIEGISGSLGHGVGMGAGFALSARQNKQKYRSFVVVGDGECYEGSVWESAMFAAHYKLDNLIAIIDRNQLCILGNTEELLEIGDLQEKWRSFGWDTTVVDGHCFSELRAAFSRIGKTDGKPLAIIANTIKGKGISYMENQPEWHNRMPNDKQITQARIELGITI
jgi:transketolase